MTRPDADRLPSPDAWPDPAADGSTTLPLAQTVAVLYLVQYVLVQLAGCGLADAR